MIVTVLLVGCGSDDDCPGGAVRDPGGGRAIGGVQADLAGWIDPERPNEARVNTNQYRFEAAAVIVDGGLADGGLILPLGEEFVVSGCEGAGTRGLMASRFGATFNVDVARGEVTRASCNGCA